MDSDDFGFGFFVGGFVVGGIMVLITYICWNSAYTNLAIECGAAAYDAETGDLVWHKDLEKGKGKR